MESIVKDTIMNHLQEKNINMASYQDDPLQPNFWAS